MVLSDASARGRCEPHVPNTEALQRLSPVGSHNVVGEPNLMLCMNSMLLLRLGTKQMHGVAIYWPSQKYAYFSRNVIPHLPHRSRWNWVSCERKVRKYIVLRYATKLLKPVYELLF
jgi:hypothetical protein